MEDMYIVIFKGITVNFWWARPLQENFAKGSICVKCRQDTTVIVLMGFLNTELLYKNGWITGIAARTDTFTMVWEND